MRTSTYDITVPLHDEDRYLLIHGIYGTVDLISAEYGRLLEQNSSDIKSLPPDIQKHLLKRGHITERSAEEEEAILERRALSFEKLHSSKDSSPTYVFIITYDCNLRCIYCFQRNIKGRSSSNSQIMTTEQIEKCFKIIRSHPPKRPQLEVFGGEPLRAEHRRLIEVIVHSAKEMGYTIAATTNGYELNHYTDLLAPDMISNLIVTIDGPSKIHDHRRPAVGGRPTYPQIVQHLDIAIKKGVQIYLRVNLDHQNLHDLPELAIDLQQRGWFEYKNFNMYYATVKSFPGLEDAHKRLTECEVIDFIEKHEEEIPILSKISYQKGGANLLKDLLSDERFLMTQTRACGAVGASIYFSPDYLLYSCHEAVGKPEYAIGSYDSFIEINKNLSHRWRQRKIPFIPKCRRCPFVLLCAGGCAYRAFACLGDDLAPYCEEYGEIFIRTIQRDWHLMKKEDSIGMCEAQERR